LSGSQQAWSSELPENAARAPGAYLASEDTHQEPLRLAVLRRLHDKLSTRLGERYDDLLDEGRAIVAEVGMPLSLLPIPLAQLAASFADGPISAPR
jgi:hypothetical protein